jgi:hypothetical protein
VTQPARPDGGHARLVNAPDDRGVSASGVAPSARCLRVAVDDIGCPGGAKHRKSRFGWRVRLQELGLCSDITSVVAIIIAAWALGWQIKDARRSEPLIEVKLTQDYDRRRAVDHLTITAVNWVAPM